MLMHLSGRVLNLKRLVLILHKSNLIEKKYDVGNDLNHKIEIIRHDKNFFSEIN